jgi:small subunit ribosomal protein S8
MTDPISDMLTRIRNASHALLPDVEIPHSKMKESIAKILKRDGYISDWSVENGQSVKKLKLKLKYQGRQGVIAGLRRVSTPGLRRYVGAQEIPEGARRDGCRHHLNPKRCDDRARRAEAESRW